MLAKQNPSLVRQKLSYIWLLLHLRHLPFLLLLSLLACDKDIEAVEPEPPTPEELLSQGPFDLVNLHLVDIINGDDAPVAATGNVLIDPIAALNELIHYAKRETKIDEKKAEELFNSPELRAQTSFQIDGVTVQDPLMNTGLRMITAAAGGLQAKDGTYPIAEYLSSKTSTGKLQLAGTAYAEPGVLPAGASGQVWVNEEEGQSLILFDPEMSQEQQFDLLEVLIHEIVGHAAGVQVGVDQPSINEERSSNIVEHVAIHHAVIDHPERFKVATQKHARVTPLQMGQILQHQAFQNSVKGINSEVGPYIHITESSRRVFPNTNGKYPASNVKTFMSLVDLNQGYEVWEDGARLDQNATLVEPPTGWTVVATRGKNGHCTMHQHNENARSMPIGGQSPTNPTFERVMKDVYGIDAGNLPNSDAKTKKMADELFKLSMQPNGKFSPTARLKVMEAIGLKAPPDANPLP